MRYVLVRTTAVSFFRFWYTPEAFPVHNPQIHLGGICINSEIKTP